MALRLDRPIYPEVMAELIDGLRSMVNAYAWVRRGLALRIPTIEPHMELSVLDEEDEMLLKASIHNLAAIEEDDAPLNAS
jgi:hypothetical protein